MIKVLIVDDEPFIRQGLKILIDWNHYGYEIVAEASNGVEAIKEIAKNDIDLIVADIKMPEMNGLELIEYVHNNISSKIKFIVLSGFYEFEYAKKAIKYNVKDYILKPIQKEELIKTLSGFREEFINIQRENSIQKEKDKIVYERYLNGIINGKYDNSNLDYVKERLKFFGNLRYIMIEMNYNMDYCMELSDEEKRKGHLEFYEEMTRWLGENYYNVIFDMSKEKTCYDIGFIYSKKLAEEENMTEKEYIAKLRQHMSNVQKYDFYIYIGEKIDNIENLELSYKSANVAKAFSNFIKSSDIAYYDEMVQKNDFKYSIEKECMDNLINMIEEDNKKEIISCIDKFYESFKNNLVDLEIIKMNINYLLFNLMNIAKELDSEANQEGIIKYISSEAFEEFISRGSSAHLKDFSLEFATYLSQLRQNTAQGILKEVDKEISLHYMDKLSLKSLSEKYYINSAYLGQIFKKRYNVSFKDYLNSYRIEKAAEILKRSDEKVYNVAIQVGYNNTDYFINKFVQLKGKTPLQYRKQFHKS